MTEENELSELSDFQNNDLAQTRQIQWEEEFFQQIVEYLSDPDEPFFCRLHFLCTDKGKVYFLDKENWWHTLIGEASNIRNRLQNSSDHHVDIVRVRDSSRGWIAYFARSREEERGVGWNDRRLIIEDNDKNFQRRARRAQKAYLEWAPAELQKVR